MRTTTILLALWVGIPNLLPAQNDALEILGLLPWTDSATTNAVPNYVSLPEVGLAVWILPEDVEQGSIQMFRLSLNSFAVKFSYTEAGAKKALASWMADPKHPAMSAEWKAGWLKRRTDKGFFQNETAATEFMKRIKTK